MGFNHVNGENVSIRVIPNLTDHERQSKTNPVVCLKNF